MNLGLSTGRVGSVLDPTRTRPAGVGWKAEGPETDRRRHSVGSVLGSGGVRSVRSVLRVAGSCKRRRNLLEFRRNLLECRRNLQKPSRSAPKIAEISLDLLESRRISPNMVQISLGSPQMSPDLTKSRLNSPDLTQSRLNVAGYCQIYI